jgi:4-hydroxybenzoate polyprenyltransferase
MEEYTNRYWWLSLVLVAGGTIGLWYFQLHMIPGSQGLTGGVVGFFLGSALAALLEDYFDQNSD